MNINTEGNIVINSKEERKTVLQTIREEIFSFRKRTGKFIVDCEKWRYKKKRQRN